MKKKANKNPIDTISIVYFYKTDCLQRFFHGRLLSIRVFFADGHYGLIVTLRGRTLSRHVINLSE